MNHLGTQGVVISHGVLANISRSGYEIEIFAERIFHPLRFLNCCH
jgi:hypothetical protein